MKVVPNHSYRKAYCPFHVLGRRLRTVISFSKVGSRYLHTTGVPGGSFFKYPVDRLLQIPLPDPLLLSRLRVGVRCTGRTRPCRFGDFHFLAIGRGLEEPVSGTVLQDGVEIRRRLTIHKD